MTARRKPIPTICNHCGGEFLAHLNQLERGNSKFCSQACRAAGWGFFHMTLAALPGTLDQIVERTRLPVITVRNHLLEMARHGESHASGLIRSSKPAARSIRALELEFAAGPSPDPEVPNELRQAREYYLHKIILGAMPGSISLIAANTKIAPATVVLHVHRMHDQCERERRKCFIVGWSRAKFGPPVPRYAAGNEDDRPCRIKAFAPKENYDRFIKKAIKSGKIKYIRERDRERMQAKTRKKNGDTLINALFGAPADRKAA